jgi:four helix bundle protein
MKEIEKYEELEVWQAAMELVQEVYGLTDKFPEDEKPGLSAHMRVAAIKIPAKIAASTGYHNYKISFWYLAIVHALLGTLETHLKTAIRLHYVPLSEAAPIMEKCKSIGRMIDELIMS